MDLDSLMDGPKLDEQTEAGLEHLALMVALFEKELAAKGVSKELRNPIVVEWFRWMMSMGTRGPQNG